MKLSVLALVGLLSAAPAFNQESPQFLTCMNTAMAQNQLNQCAADEDARADAELNRTYQLLLSKAKQVPGATQKIQKAERAWIQFRDAYMDAMYQAEDKQANYGPDTRWMPIRLRLNWHGTRQKN